MLTALSSLPSRTSSPSSPCSTASLCSVWSPRPRPLLVSTSPRRTLRSSTRLMFLPLAPVSPIFALATLSRPLSRPVTVSSCPPLAAPPSRLVRRSTCFSEMARSLPRSPRSKRFLLIGWGWPVFGHIKTNKQTKKQKTHLVNRFLCMQIQFNVKQKKNNKNSMIFDKIGPPRSFD